jgi:two-component system NtrC family sensor kinase
MHRLSITGDILVMVKQDRDSASSATGFENATIIGFAVCLVVIPLLLVLITGVLTRRIRTSEDQRETILTELRQNQKLSAIGRLAAGVAHEINNPLSIINESAGLMNDLIEMSDDFTYREKFTELTDSVIRSVDRCRNVTHRLLGYARQIDVKVEPMDVNAVIRDVSGFIATEAVLRKIDVRLILEEHIHGISSDKGQIQQVLLNLLSNACSAVNDGGIITVTSENNGKDHVKIMVEDNGCGIPESDLDHVFDPYFSTNNKNGIGLGLAISHAVITKLGGTITVKSRKNEGTTFTVILPVTHQRNP